MSTQPRSHSFAPTSGATIPHFGSVASISTTSIQKNEPTVPTGIVTQDVPRQLNPLTQAVSINNKIISLGRDYKWQDILELHGERKDDFNNVCYATVMTQFGRIKSLDTRDPRFHAFLYDLQLQLQSHGVMWMGARQFSNIVHGFSKMNLEGNDIAMDIINLLERETEWLYDHGNSQDTSNCIWACGKLGIKSPNLFAALDREADRVFQDAHPQDIANSVWACAKLGIQLPNLFALLNREAQIVVERGTSEAVASCLWACGKLGFESPNLFSVVDRDAQRIFGIGSPQAVAICVEAFAALNTLPRNLLDLLERNPSWLVDRCKPRDIAVCARAISKFGYPMPRYFASVRQNLDRFIVDSNPHDVIMLCGAMAVLNMYSGSHARMFHRLWNRIMKWVDGSVSAGDLRLILYIQSSADAAGIAMAKPSESAQAKLDALEFPVESSSFADEVSTKMVDIGFSHERNISPFESTPGFLSIDLACKDRMVAVVCIGPEDFINVLGEDSQVRVENGPVKAKIQILQNLGWNVMCLASDVRIDSQLSPKWLSDNIKLA